MCGLVGVVGLNLSTKHLEAMRWLLHLDVLRGEDSTGVAVLNERITGPDTKKKLTLLKTEGHPSRLYSRFPEVFTSNGSFQEELKHNYHFVMGHNRSKTIGAVNAKNAHPFHHGKIVGAHNGTIRLGLYELPKGAELLGDTDSERIFYALSKGTTLQKVVDTLAGAMAFSWYDTEANTYHLFRNKERPLHYAISADKTSLLYASEAWMLRIAISKSGLASAINAWEPVALAEDEHISFPLEEKLVLTSTEIKQTKKAQGRVTYYDDYSEYGPYSGYYGSNSGSRKLRTPNKPGYLSKTQPPASNVTQLRSSSGWLHFKGLPVASFNTKTKHGCSYCSDNLSYEDNLAGKVFWLDSDTPLCETCATTQFKKEG